MMIKVTNITNQERYLQFDSTIKQYSSAPMVSRRVGPYKSIFITQWECQYVMSWDGFESHEEDPDGTTRKPDHAEVPWGSGSAEKIDKSELLVQMSLAHTYMFLDDMENCKNIHKRFLNQNVSVKQTWKNKVINDLDEFKKAGLSEENFNKVLRLVD